VKTAGKGKHNISRECSVLCTRKTCGGTRLHPPELTSHVLVMTVAPHVHREYRHVRPWRKLLGGVSLSPRGTGQIFRFPGKRIGNVSPPFRQRPDRQRTALLLLFVSLKIVSSFHFKSTVEKSFTMSGSPIPRCLRLK
jgi:hypothetical protein